MLGIPIPEGLRRESMSRRTKSIDRLDRIIKLGGVVGEMFSIVESDEKKIRRSSTLSNIDHMTFDDLDLDTKADSASYSHYGKLINKECKEKGIPTPYPGGIQWTFRNTNDRVRIVNTLICLLIQRRAAENVILDLKEEIDLLQEDARSAVLKNKELTELIAVKDIKLAHLNSGKKIKRNTDSFHKKEELFRQKEKSFKKEAKTFRKREQQMNIDFKKLTKELAITKKAKTDVDRKHQLLQKQKRNIEIQYRNIQKRLKSKLDKLSKTSTSNLDIRQIGEFTLFETQGEGQLRKRKNPEDIARGIVDEWNQNILTNFEKLKVENELLRNDLEDLKQKYRALIEDRDCSKSPQNEWFGPPLPKENADGIHAEQSNVKQSVYDFYFDRLTEIFTEFVPDSLDEIPSLLWTYPQKEHFIYERVCYQFGITPIEKYFGPATLTARASITETKRTRSRTNPATFPSDESKSDDIQWLSTHRATPSMNSVAWLDDSGLDLLSVELDKGWSFAESCSAASPFIEGVSPNKNSNHSPYHSPCLK